MNENIQEFLYNSIGIIIFILAISLFLIINLSTFEMNNIIYNSFNSDKVLYEKDLIIKDKKVAGAEIIYQIHKGLTCDIQIDTNLIQKDIDGVLFDYLVIDPNKIFNVETKIDSTGKINKIIYN